MAKSPQNSTSQGSRSGQSASRPPAAKHHRGDPAETGETTIAGVRLTHPDRILWPEMGLTKERLARYYEAVADALLPHLVNRPLTLLRCPGGREKVCFIQKHGWAGIPAGIRRMTFNGEELLFVEDLSGVVGLVQAGTLELHPWGASLPDLERPDRLVMDLDPGAGIAWPQMAAAAREVRDRLAAAGLESFLKTSGGRGLHVVAPLSGNAGWDEAKAFTKALARAMEADSPDRYLARSVKDDRQGRIFVDYLRNTRGQTAVAPYSTRARAGATVSTPLDWSELTPDLDPAAFTVETVPMRLRKGGRDPWPDIGSVRQSLPTEMSGIA